MATTTTRKYKDPRAQSSYDLLSKFGGFDEGAFHQSMRAAGTDVSYEDAGAPPKPTPPSAADGLTAPKPNPLGGPSATSGSDALTGGGAKAPSRYLGGSEGFGTPPSAADGLTASAPVPLAKPAAPAPTSVEVPSALDALSARSAANEAAGGSGNYLDQIQRATSSGAYAPDTRTGQRYPGEPGYEEWFASIPRENTPGAQAMRNLTATGNMATRAPDYAPTTRTNPNYDPTAANNQAVDDGGATAAYTAPTPAAPPSALDGLTGGPARYRPGASFAIDRTADTVFSSPEERAAYQRKLDAEGTYIDPYTGEAVSFNDGSMGGTYNPDPVRYTPPPSPLTGSEGFASAADGLPDPTGLLERMRREEMGRDVDAALSGRSLPTNPNTGNVATPGVSVRLPGQPLTMVTSGQSAGEGGAVMSNDRAPGGDGTPYGEREPSEYAPPVPVPSPLREAPDERHGKAGPSSGAITPAPAPVNTSTQMPATSIYPDVTSAADGLAGLAWPGVHPTPGGPVQTAPPTGTAAIPAGQVPLPPGAAGAPVSPQSPTAAPPVASQPGQVPTAPAPVTTAAYAPVAPYAPPAPSALDGLPDAVDRYSDLTSAVGGLTNPYDDPAYLRRLEGRVVDTAEAQQLASKRQMGANFARRGLAGSGLEQQAYNDLENATTQTRIRGLNDAYIGNIEKAAAFALDKARGSDSFATTRAAGQTGYDKDAYQRAVDQKTMPLELERMRISNEGLQQAQANLQQQMEMARQQGNMALATSIGQVLGLIGAGGLGWMAGGPMGAATALGLAGGTQNLVRS